MHLSVLIPAYNTAEYIGQCLDSILAQEHQDFDVVVVDDGSKDKTNAVVQEYMPGRPITLITMPDHSNVTEATWVGLRCCKGPVVTVVDSDDRVLPGSFDVVQEFDKDPDLSFAWTRIQLSTGQAGYTGPLPAGQSLKEALLNGWWRAQHQKFFRQCDYRATQGLSPYIDRASDFQLVALLSTLNKPVKFVDRETYWYRVGRPGSLTCQGREKQRECAERIKQWMRKNVQ